MSHTLTVAGLDPSMSNFGMVKAVLDLSNDSFVPTHMSLVETKPAKAKKTVRKNSIDLLRARKIIIELHEFIKDVDMVFVEIPVGSQSARAMASYGMCIGILSSLNDKPMIQVTPAEVKIAGAGRKTATKQEMIDWATSTFPVLDWFTKKVKGKVSYTLKNEHLADALAAIQAGIRTDQYHASSTMMRAAINK